jgi:hypothetical protein
VPIPYREILLASRAMETILDQLRVQLPDRLAVVRSRADLAFQAQPLASEVAVPAREL